MQIIISFGVNYNLDIVTRFIHNVLNNGDKKKNEGGGFLTELYKAHFCNKKHTNGHKAESIPQFIKKKTLSTKQPLF